MPENFVKLSAQLLLQQRDVERIQIFVKFIANDWSYCASGQGAWKAVTTAVDELLQFTLLFMYSYYSTVMMRGIFSTVEDKQASRRDSSPVNQSIKASYQY